MNILVLTGSYRKKGNSNVLAENFIKGAESAGHNVVRIDTAEKNILECRVCNTCFSRGPACTFNDDFCEIAEEVIKADVVVLATPLYWFTMSAKLKLAIDKFYAFCVAGKKISGKKAVLLACGEGSDEDFAGLKVTYKQIIDYLRWENRGMILVSGVGRVGAIKGHPLLENAEQLGKNL